MTTTPPHTTRIPAEATAWSYDRAGLHLSSPRVDDRPEREDFTPERAFTRSIEEGRRRLNRRFPALVATGLVGGVDVATGVLAYLLVMEETGSKPLAGLAFGVGFVALTLARSELFTEGFLVPVTTVAARKSRVSSLFRLWGVTAAANLAGGWVITALIVLGLPHLSSTAVDVAAFYAGLGVSGRAFALAVLGGAVITLMTWMQHTTEVVAAKLVAAVAGAFLLATGSLNHAVIDSLVMFTALHTGETAFGYAEWAATAGWAALGNIVGGVGLVTTLRLLQVPHRVALERRHPEV